MTTEIIEQPTKLAMDLNSVFSRAWKRFTEKFISLLGVFGMSILFVSILLVIGSIIVVAVFSAAAFFPAAFFEPTTLILAGAVFFVWLALFTWLMSTVSALQYNTLAYKKSFGEIWNMSHPKALGLLGVGAVMGLAILGGFFLFIIPGIWIGTLLAFTYAVYILENKTWQDALRKSITLVSYEFWNVFLPFLIIFVATILLTILGPLGSILNIALGIFATVLAYELYESLNINYPQADVDARKQSLLWVGILSGFSALAITVLFALGTFFATTAMANGFDLKSFFNENGEMRDRPYNNEEFQDVPFDYSDYQTGTFDGTGVNSVY
jgi:hypothetical protein